VHKRILLITLFASALLATSFVHAQTDILLGNGTNGSVQFTGNGAGANVTLLGTCGANSCVQGSAGIGFSNPGSFEMDLAQPLVITNVLGSSGGYNMSGAVTFTFVLASGAPLGAGSLTGTIYFTSFADGSYTQSFNGYITTTSVTGSLQSLFGLGTANGVFFAVSNTSGTPVESIFGNDGLADTIVERPGYGGVPGPSPVPEPPMIAMLGSGLLALAGTLKCRLFK
jgi:hypothetical protein